MAENALKALSTRNVLIPVKLAMLGARVTYLLKKQNISLHLIPCCFRYESFTVDDNSNKRSLRSTMYKVLPKIWIIVPNFCETF